MTANGPIDVNKEQSHEEGGSPGEESSCSLALSQFAENHLPKGNASKHQFRVNLFSGNNFAVKATGLVLWKLSHNYSKRDLGQFAATVS